MKKPTKLEDIPSGSVVPQKPVLSRCANCKKANPEISSYPAGESSDAVQVIFVLECCRVIVGAQLIAKNTAMGEAAGEPVKVM